VDPCGDSAPLFKLGVPYLGADDALFQLDPSSVFLANGLGSVKCTRVRAAAFFRFNNAGFSFPPLVHPLAIVDEGCAVGEASQIMAGVVLQANACVGINSIVNTSASVDHDCRIGNHCHIAPGVTLSGNVFVGDGAHIGTGAVVIQCVGIGSNAVVGAGAVVIHDVKEATVVVGVPAR
jgi:UDP-perosamine 4-acetyltransferase